jgi:FG-GAP repeat
VTSCSWIISIVGLAGTPACLGLPDGVSSEALAVTALAVGDVDGDGIADLVLGSERDERRGIEIRPSLAGDLGARAPLFIPTRLPPRAIAIGKLDTSSSIDVVTYTATTSEQELVVMRDGGRGATLTRQTTTEIAGRIPAVNAPTALLLDQFNIEPEPWVVLVSGVGALKASATRLLVGDNASSQLIMDSFPFERSETIGSFQAGITVRIAKDTVLAWQRKGGLGIAAQETTQRYNTEDTSPFSREALAAFVPAADKVALLRLANTTEDAALVSDPVGEPNPNNGTWTGCEGSLYAAPSASAVRLRLLSLAAGNGVPRRDGLAIWSTSSAGSSIELRGFGTFIDAQTCTMAADTPDLTLTVDLGGVEVADGFVEDLDDDGDDELYTITRDGRVRCDTLDRTTLTTKRCGAR